MPKDSQEQKPLLLESETAAGVNRWERGFLVSVMFASVLYLGAILWAGADNIWEAIRLIPGWGIGVSLVAIFIDFSFRFLRWHLYLYKMGHVIPWGSSFHIFLASFALVASPGRAGEAIKLFLLKRRYHVPIAQTLAGLMCERITDLLSVLVICVLAFSIQYTGAVLAMVALPITGVLLLQQPALLKRYLIRPMGRFQVLQTQLLKLEILLDSTGDLLKPIPLFGGTVLALIAWGIEGLVLYGLFQFLGAISITPYQSILIHTTSGLIGALSMLPGGIGGTESTAIGLSLFYGATQTQAIAATFLIRLMTLWFAVAIGIVALLTVQGRSTRPVG